jgi:hypothetical protein
MSSKYQLAKSYRSNLYCVYIPLVGVAETVPPTICAYNERDDPSSLVVYLTLLLASPLNDGANLDR